MPSTYTYDDFMKAANESGLANSFDDNDLGVAQKYPEFGLSMLSLKRDLGNAQTNEQKLLVNEAMNQLRKNYGTYWTGDQGNRSYATSFGSKINDAMDQIGSYGAFEYRNDNDYKNLLDRIINREEFRYDPATDPIFSSFKKTYNREGDRAAANALAAAAAATGGRVSSFAETAAQQAANYYAGKLADAVPQLRNQALTEYNNELSQLLQALGAMDTDRAQQYEEYNNRFNQLQQNLTNLRAQDESDYNRYLDMLNAEYQRERDVIGDEQTQFENALNIYRLTGQVTGKLADYLNGTPAATTPTAGGSYASGGYGSYRGGLSGNANTAEDEALQNELDSILGKYTDSYGRVTGSISKISDYQRIKELTGLTDEELNGYGVQYAYPVERDANGNLLKDANGNIIPSKIGSKIYEDYDAAAGNYSTVSQTLETLRQQGASKENVLNQIKAAYKQGVLNSTDYNSLYNKYRNLNATEDYGSKYVATLAAAKAQADGQKKTAATKAASTTSSNTSSTTTKQQAQAAANKAQADGQKKTAAVKSSGTSTTSTSNKTTAAQAAAAKYQADGQKKTATTKTTTVVKPSATKSTTKSSGPKGVTR